MHAAYLSGLLKVRKYAC